MQLALTTLDHDITISINCVNQQIIVASNNKQIRVKWVFLKFLYSFLQTTSTEVQFGPMKLIKDPLQVQWHWCFLDECARLCIPSIKTRRGRNAEMDTLWRRHGLSRQQSQTFVAKNIPKWTVQYRESMGLLSLQIGHSVIRTGSFILGSTFSDVRLKATGCSILGLQDEFWWILWLWNEKFGFTQGSAGLLFLFQRIRHLLNENNEQSLLYLKSAADVREI